MKEIVYVIKDEIGIHARPAGNLVKIAKESKSEIEIFSNGKSADLKKIFSVLSLAVKCGDEIRVKISGEDEEITGEKIERYLTDNL